MPPGAGAYSVLPTVGDMDFEFIEGFKGGLTYGIGLDATYFSNFFLEENDSDSEVSLSITPQIAYISDPEGGAPVSFVVSYSPGIQTYFDNPDLNGVGHGGNFSLIVEGSKTVISAQAQFSQSLGTDPLIGEFVTQSLFSASLGGSYQIAPRTTLFAGFDATTSDFGSDSVVGSNIYTASFGGYWSATENLSFGPAIQYSVALSDNTGTRDAWALIMQARYNVNTRIQVTGSLGVDYATNSRDDEDPIVGLTGRLAASYSITEKLSWSTSVLYITIPAPTEVDYVINNLTVSTALSRQLLRGSISVGIELNLAIYEVVGPAVDSLDNENNVGTFISYSRPVIADTVTFESSVLYAVNDGQSNWSQFQFSIGLNAQF